MRHNLAPNNSGVRMGRISEGPPEPHCGCYPPGPIGGTDSSVTTKSPASVLSEYTALLSRAVMPFLDSLYGPITRIINIVRQPQAEVGETTEPSLDGQARVESSSEMHQKLPNDRDGSRTVGDPTNGRHGGRPKAVSGTASHRHHGEHRSGREDQAESRFRAQAAHLKTLENDRRQLADKHESLERNHSQLSEEHQAAKASLRVTEITCKKQQQEINVLRGKLRDTSALLDDRNQELKVAKTFLSKEDPFSTSDVVRSVRDLNSEIMQTAAHLTENLPLKRTRIPLVGEIPEGPYKTLFVALVLPRKSGEEVDAGLLELAMQGFLVISVYWIANVWGFNQASGWCDELYLKVRETEDRTVASNWRALTRRSLSNIDSSWEGLPRRVVDDMINQLAQLLSSCGVGETVTNANNIHKHAADKLGSLFTAARKLNKMIGENVVSDDLMVTVIGGDHLFDGEQMEDAYARGGLEPIRCRAVICTTDLGLCEKGVEGNKVLLKPKVALRDL